MTQNPGTSQTFNGQSKVKWRFVLFGKGLRLFSTSFLAFGVMGYLQQLLQSPLLVELFRLSVWLLIVMIIFVPLEKLCFVHRQKIFRAAFFTDLIYFFLSGLAPKILLALPMSFVAWGLHDIMPVQLHQQVAAWPIGARLAAAMVVGEFGSYWGHRWMHEVPFLWRFHAIHHSAKQIDWLVNTRAHPLDLAFPRLLGFILMYLAGLAQPTGNQMDPVSLSVILIGTVWGFFIHANLRWRFGWLEFLFTTPAFHHWHHTNDGLQFINKNYAPLLPWMDWLFGTYYLPKNQWPKRYGITEPVPDNIFDQLIRPFYFQKKRLERKTD